MKFDQNDAFAAVFVLYAPVANWKSNFCVAFRMQLFNWLVLNPHLVAHLLVI